MTLILSFLLNIGCAAAPGEDYSDEFVNQWWEFLEEPLFIETTSYDCFILDELDDQGGELLAHSDDGTIWRVSQWYWTVEPNIYKIEEQYELVVFPSDEDNCWDVEYSFLNAKVCLCTSFPRVAK